MAFDPHVILPGGPLIAGLGSYLQIWNWTAAVETDTIEPIDYSYLDIVWANLTWDYITPIDWYSGSKGAMRRNIIAADWTITCKVWFDYTNPPENVFIPQDKNDFAFKLTIGADVAWTNEAIDMYRLDDFVDPNNPNIVNATNPQGALNDPGLLDPNPPQYIPIYAAPRAFLTNNNIIESSEGEDYCTNIITLSGNSLLWFIDSQKQENKYRNYVQSMAKELGA